MLIILAILIHLFFFGANILILCMIGNDEIRPHVIFSKFGHCCHALFVLFARINTSISTPELQLIMEVKNGHGSPGL